MSASDTLILMFGIFFIAFFGFCIQLTRIGEIGKPAYYKAHYYAKGYTFEQFMRAFYATWFFAALCLAGWLVTGYQYVMNFQK